MAHGWNMTDRKPLVDQNETPEDVATLYSWANLHGAKYRDFSASRAQTREKARLRVQEAISEEQERAKDQPRDESEAERAAAAQRAAESARIAESEIAAHHATQQAVQQSAWQQPSPGRYAALSAARLTGSPGAYGPAPQQPDPRPYPPINGIRTTAPPNSPRNGNANGNGIGREETPRDLREDFGRPAWLAPMRDVSGQPVPHAPEDTLQGSRDRLTSRWFALKGVFDGSAAPARAEVPAPVAPPTRAPVLAVFSLAGGVGKTSLVATLARALSGRGERVLLVDTATYGLLPFFFGARDQRPGVLRTFTPPGATGDAPIQLVTIDPDTLAPESPNEDKLSEEIAKQSRSANRVLVDLATASGATTRRIIRLAPMVLVPVIPDMSSVVSVGSIDGFFRHHPGPNGKQLLPYYLLNQFDHSLPLHLDVREVLREQLGDRLLPFVMRRSPAVSEALAEGMTVVDYAPNSPLAEDFLSLAGWIKNIAAPASSSYRGVRWSER